MIPQSRRREGPGRLGWGLSVYELRRGSTSSVRAAGQAGRSICAPLIVTRSRRSARWCSACGARGVRGRRRCRNVLTPRVVVTRRRAAYAAVPGKVIAGGAEREARCTVRRVLAFMASTGAAPEAPRKPTLGKSTGEAAARNFRRAKPSSLAARRRFGARAAADL